MRGHTHQIRTPSPDTARAFHGAIVRAPRYEPGLLGNASRKCDEPIRPGAHNRSRRSTLRLFLCISGGQPKSLRKEPKARLIPGARPSGAGFALGSESQVRCSLAGGGRRFRTIGRALKETAVQGRPAANYRPLARRPVLNDLHPAHRSGRQQLRDPFSQERDRWFETVFLERRVSSKLGSADR